MNFVFFMPDQLRADALGCYGNPVASTPNHDRLAAEGSRFDQCHIQMPLCSPSRCCMMTGWYPHVQGHRTLRHLLGADDPSMLRYLKDAGYRVEVYGKNDVFDPAHARLATDCAAHKWGGFPERIFDRGDPGYYSFLYGPTPGGPENSMDWPNVQAGIDFLRSPRAKGQPFMLFLPLVMPHPPYSAPQPYHTMYRPEDVTVLPPREGDVPAFERLIRRYRGLDELDESFFRQVRAVYLGMVSYVDWMLGRLLDALDESGLADETTVIVSSDHGDFAGDYGLVEKHHSCFRDAMTRVPLIIRTPGAKAGHVGGEQVEQFDIMATVLELAEVQAQHTHFSQSLAGALQGAPGDPDRAVFGTGGYNATERHCFEGYHADDALWNPEHIYSPQTRQHQQHPESNCRTAMIRTRDWKLVYRLDETSELYDLRNDPHEMHNRYGEAALSDVRNELTERLLRRIIQTSDVVPHVESAREWPSR